TPDYKVMEDVEGEEVSIGSKKSVNDVVKPYKALYRGEDKWTGTVSDKALNDLLGTFEGWEYIDLVLENNDLSANELNELVRADNHLTIFFSGEVPFSLFNVIFPFTHNDLPETAFSQIIIDWNNYNNKELQLFFVSANNTILYRSQVNIPNTNQFLEKVIEPSKKFSEYEEIKRDEIPSLYVTNDKIESVKYTYLIEDISPDLFRNALFIDPNFVERSNVEGKNEEKYTDGMSEMIVDKDRKLLTYVYPAAESSNRVPPSKILNDSFEFINEHGGLTADYRFVRMDTTKNRVDYQLFLQGFPVYSDQTDTRITTIWGNERIFRYMRPYYSLDEDILSEKETKELPSGKEIIEKVREMNHIAFSEVDEIAVGYYLTRYDNQILFTLEQNWFLLHNGSWTRLTPEMLGGVENGLE
ncbi:MAG: two-component system activity regulator YycH, partial [Lysinibacillus sp.]